MSNASQMCWRWELTPAELFAGFSFIKSEPAKDLALERRPFDGVPYHTLEGTSFVYQLAISDRCVTADMLAIRRVQPQLPVSGDRRSGVLVFDDGRIIGACVIPGLQVLQGYRMVVHPDYRQHGLAFRMLVEWCWQTKRQKVLPTQGVTLNSAKALLKSHKIVVERALAKGFPVPSQVTQTVERGEEAARIIKEATRIEQIILPSKTRSQKR